MYYIGLLQFSTSLEVDFTKIVADVLASIYMHVYNTTYMAKKKKHKKTRNSRRHRVESTANTSASTLSTEEPAVVTSNLATKAEKPAKTKGAAASMTYDDVELSYVRTDIKHTLILIALILAVYAVLWVLVTYTSVGTQLTNMMSYK